MISVAIVDNGEPNAERSLRSLRDQTLQPEILLCGGPKTDYELARSLADKVLGPVEGIGKARVQGILEASCDNIVSADTDSIYAPTYCETANMDLKNLSAVRAGFILPLELKEPLTMLETTLSPLVPYEFAYAFRRTSFCNAGIHMEDYSYKRADIGVWVSRRLLPLLDPRMIVYTRFPTEGAKIAAQYLPSMLAAGAPFLTLAALTQL